MLKKASTQTKHYKRKNMTVKSKLTQIFIIVNLFCLSANAQNQHTLNEKWLKERAKTSKTIVLLNNQQSLIPLKNLVNNKVASISFSPAIAAGFDSMLNNYTKVSSFDGSTYLSNLADLSYDLKFYQTLIIQLSEDQLNNPQVLTFIRDNQSNKQIILTIFGKAGSLEKLDEFSLPIIWSENQSDIAANYTAQAIFGGLPLYARLDRSKSAKYNKGQGYSTQATRLSYSVPEEVGINSVKLLDSTDAIMAEAIKGRAAPGGVLLVIKDGKVILNKAYGAHTYEGILPVKTTDIFDLASVTKTTATTPAVMRLYEEGKLNLNAEISNYIPKAAETNKAHTPVRQIMLHEAGFTPFIPFFKDIKPIDFRTDSSAAYPVTASENYHFRKDFFKEVMWPKMLNSAIKDTGKYVYSDLSMYFMKEIVEDISTDHLENYVQKNFYQPLGMQSAGYNPLYRFPKDQIIPTEIDTLFRNTLLVGYVHDPGASMVAGISGHAGLFSSATDLAIFYQMLLNGGSYGGQTYFKPETVKLFTSKQSRTSRRGLGFDRSDVKEGYPSKLASANSFGHTGYTGIRVWVDQDVNLIYVLLTNRVHPVTSSKLGDLNISPRLMDAIYQTLPSKK